MYTCSKCLQTTHTKVLTQKRNPGFMALFLSNYFLNGKSTPEQSPVFKDFAEQIAPVQPVLLCCVENVIKLKTAKGSSVLASSVKIPNSLSLRLRDVSLIQTMHMLL